jgi:hypothetical protein
MRQLTPSEIVRTAFRRVDPVKRSPYGHIHPDTDANTMCPYCKNEDTEKVTDSVDLNPFRDVYKERKHQVMHCHCCNAVWSYFW